MTKTDDVIAEIRARVLTRPRHIRKGQAAFSALHFLRPDLADEILGTPFDPFYNSEVLPDFYRRVRELVK